VAAAAGHVQTSVARRAPAAELVYADPLRRHADPRVPGTSGRLRVPQRVQVVPRRDVLPLDQRGPAEVAGANGPPDHNSRRVRHIGGHRCPVRRPPVREAGEVELLLDVALGGQVDRGGEERIGVLELLRQPVSRHGAGQRPDYPGHQVDRFGGRGRGGRSEQAEDEGDQPGATPCGDRHGSSRSGGKEHRERNGPAAMPARVRETKRSRRSAHTAGRSSSAPLWRALWAAQRAFLADETCP
jgi:hypothetical protein